MKANADWWDTDEQRVSYAFGCLNDTAANRLGSYFEEDSGRTVKTLEEFYTLL